MSVNWPAVPHACSSDETPSSATNTGGVSRWSQASTPTAPSATARSVASAPASPTPRRDRSQRPKSTMPSAPGSEYAASAAATHSPCRAGGASSSASQATATALMPSPSADSAYPGGSRRRAGWLSAGQYGHACSQPRTCLAAAGRLTWVWSSIKRG